MTKVEPQPTHKTQRLGWDWGSTFVESCFELRVKEGSWNPNLWKLEPQPTHKTQCLRIHVTWILFFGVFENVVTVWSVIRRPTVEFDPFIKSHLAPRNAHRGLTWCKFGRVTLQI